MCANKHKTARSMRPKRPTTTTTATARRKTRTKTRKHRLISLLRDQSPLPENHHQQLTLFPLHPENRLEDTLEEDASSLFATADAGTLSGLIWDAGVNGLESTEEDTWSASVRCGAGSSLEKTALRNSRERDEEEEEEERWVRYSEVVEKREKEEEVTSCPVEYWTNECSTRGGLLLKLDYQEIMDAWIDKGSLYIDGDQGPGIVPDVLDHVAKLEDHSWSSVKVPEMGNGEEKDGGAEGEGWKIGRDREARVLRYKEKRQSRLFAKRIRYEVRKLNAEKRPRIKGRFVKRC